MPEEKLTIADFASAVRSKYNAYEDVEDSVLVEKIIEKYPEYSSQVEMSTDVKVEEPEAVVEEKSLDSPYLANATGEFVTGRGEPTKIDPLSKEDVEKSKEIITAVEKKEKDSKDNLKNLQSYQFIDIPGQDYELKEPSLGLDGVPVVGVTNDQNQPTYNEPSYLDNKYRSIVDKKDADVDGVSGASGLPTTKEEWFTTDEGNAWWEQNWWKKDNVLIEEGLADNPDYINTGIRYGGKINYTKALNSEIGTILNDDGLKFPLKEGFVLDPEIIEKAKENINLKNIKILSDFYGNKTVGQAGFHQRELIRLDSENKEMNPLGVGYGANFTKNLEQIDFHRNEILKLRKDYFSKQYDEDGIPNEWYNPLSGEMIKKKQATPDEMMEESQAIAIAQNKWGDTNIEVLYSKEK